MFAELIIAKAHHTVEVQEGLGGHSSQHYDCICKGVSPKTEIVHVGRQLVDRNCSPARVRPDIKNRFRSHGELDQREMSAVVVPTVIRRPCADSINGMDRVARSRRSICHCQFNVCAT